MAWREVEQRCSPQRVIHVEIQRVRIVGLYFFRSGTKLQTMHGKAMARLRKIVGQLPFLPLDDEGVSIRTRP